jgi:hypothetical protein
MRVLNLVAMALLVLFAAIAVAMQLGGARMLDMLRQVHAKYL